MEHLITLKHFDTQVYVLTYVYNASIMVPCYNHIRITYCKPCFWKSVKNVSISKGDGREREGEWRAALISRRSATRAQPGSIQARHHIQIRLDATTGQLRMICR